MHYIPESTSEMLRGDSARCLIARPNYHYVSAPLYLLTGIVAALLFLDWFLSFRLSAIDATAGAAPIVFGYRLALLAALLGGARILYHTLDGLLSGRVGADLALTLACLAAIVVGEYQTAGMVVLISLIGESIEGYTIDRARWAVGQTFALWPTLAHRSLNGSEEDIPIEDLRVGDVVTVRPGERVPVDGPVLAGTSVVDQSPFTGESMPVDKVPGDHLLAGMLNQFGALTVVAESIGENTTLARMAQLVGAATARKANLEQTADRLARWFLPMVLLAAFATLIGWRFATGSWQNGLLPSLGVLVVACPCPLVLATPCAVMASLAWLARRGVVVKGSAVLERLASVDTFVFDKTGTLTQGTLALGGVIATTGQTSNTILRIAAVAERNSEHPMARVLVKAASERGLMIPSPMDFAVLAGAGVRASLRISDMESGEAGRDATDQFALGSSVASIVVGNRRALDQSAIAYSDDVARLLKEREASGESPLVVAVDGIVIGVIGIRETIRAESHLVLADLRALGISRFVLLTGDRPQIADVVVRSLGTLADFECVATEQQPADKATWIETAQRAGQRVAMVGDGANDAPALAVASVGIALANAGNGMAAAAGDIVLLGDPLLPLPGLVRLSRALVQNIWQSILIFAFGLNVLGVLACSLRWLDPIGGALFHEAASLAVMANSMRLLWFENRPSTRITRWLAQSFSMAEWLVENASPSKLVFWFAERWRIATKLVAAAVFAVWLLSGIVLLTDDEQAVVQRFGRFEASLSSGLHWRWPLPFERVVRNRVNQVRSVTVGYRRPLGDRKPPIRAAAANASEISRERTANRLDPSTTLPIVEWTSSHDDRDQILISDESAMLTSDEVPIELMAEVQYQVRDLKEFAFAGSRRPDDVVRACAESVLREIAAAESLDSLLTDRRAMLERQSVLTLRDRINSYAIGVEVVDLQWLDVHPPQPVVPAYRQVADALEEREQLINEAQAYACRTLVAAVGNEAFIRLQAEARGQIPGEWNSPSHTDWKLTDDLWKQLNNKDAAGQTIIAGTASSILLEGLSSSVDREMLALGTSHRFESLYQEYRRMPQLTGQYLYWMTITEVLTRRPLTIIDPKAVGRHHVWLGDQIPGAWMRAPKEDDERK